MGFVKDIFNIPSQAIATTIRLAALVYYLMLGLLLCGLVWYMIYKATEVLI